MGVGPRHWGRLLLSQVQQQGAGLEVERQQLYLLDHRASPLFLLVLRRTGKVAFLTRGKNCLGTYHPLAADSPCSVTDDCSWDV